MPSPSLRSLMQVEIFFHRSEIGHLFSELLEQRGIHSTLLQSLEDSKLGTPLVTEPSLYQQIRDGEDRQTLLVGQGTDTPCCNAVLLSRPLTIPKVQTALDQFLENCTKS